MSSLRILSYNTQLRSWAMEVGWPPSIPPKITAEDRAGFIADNILASDFDYDIVGLCEVFDEDAREILVSRLRGRFPHIVGKADWDYVELHQPSGDQTLGLMAQWHLLGIVEVESSWRLEDSGLMLFSKWPFATLGTAGLDPAIVALSQVAGYPVPAVVPAVNFLPFEDTSGNDGDAAKGCLYARVERFPGVFTHLFLSHTQADTTVVEENRGTRTTQIGKVAKFIELNAGGVPFTEEVFFMGDLNINGELAGNADLVREPPSEWTGDFLRLGNLLSDFAVDLWGRRQCVGGKDGLRDTGVSATVRYQPRQQRLDYVFGSTSSSLAAQHLMIDRVLAQPPPGHKDISYLSDHRPLRIELATRRPHSTPAEAFRVPENPAVFSTNAQEWLIEGQVMWFRFDRAGTYEFRLIQDDERLSYAVYLDTDLSTPRQQYHKESHPDFGERFVIPGPPFLVKVFPKSRTGEAFFRFRSHRHEGAGPADAIVLPYGEPVQESLPPGQLLNTDFGATDWDDTDTKWFRLDGPLTALAAPLAVRLEVARTRGDAPFDIALAREDPPGVWTLLDRASGGDVLAIDTTIGTGEHQYLQVTRRDQPGQRDLEFTATATTDVSIIVGGAVGDPQLVCTEETGGWGSDDIELGITVDGTPYAYIDNDQIGDFDQDDPRQLAQWMPGLVPYRTGVEFMVKELDDVGHDDIGRETLRPLGQLAGWDRFQIDHQISAGRVAGFLRVDVDDGRYDVGLTVTGWDEMF